MNPNPLFISIIIPVFNEESNLQWHHQKITNYLKNTHLRYEIIYINDGSTDGSFKTLGNLLGNKSVKILSFSRNFGKEAATSAGLKYASGDIALLLDADGQHPIELLDKFIDQWRNGSQVVIGVRKSNTKEGFIKHYGSKLFYLMLNAVSSGKTIPGSTDYRLLDRRVIDEFNKLTEHNRITRGLIDWMGFRRSVVEFSAAARHSGEATYGFGKLVKLALHAFVSQTTRPLQFGGVLGSVTVILSAATGVFLLVETYLLGDPLRLAITGTAILAIFVSFLVGLVLICQWLLALYIESIHNETQNRPLYIIDEEK
ncbi:MAG: glycosyltransferase family 2 protein [Candidatus Saccharimonadales bacterium]